eukprot:scaffold2325_cov257-Pinguiococcus_pyrenoidosus.AAC.10
MLRFPSLADRSDEIHDEIIWDRVLRLSRQELGSGTRAPVDVAVGAAGFPRAVQALENASGGLGPRACRRAELGGLLQVGDIDRILPAGNGDGRLHAERRAHDDDLEVRPPPQKLSQDDEEEPPQQDARRAEEQSRVSPSAPLQSDLVADVTRVVPCHARQRAAPLLRNALRHTYCGDASRLRANHARPRSAAGAQRILQNHLWDLRCLAASRRAGDHRDLLGGHSGEDVLSKLVRRKPLPLPQDALVGVAFLQLQLAQLQPLRRGAGVFLRRLCDLSVRRGHPLPGVEALAQRRHVEDAVVQGQRPQLHLSAPLRRFLRLGLFLRSRLPARQRLRRQRIGHGDSRAVRHGPRVQQLLAGADHVRHHGLALGSQLGLRLAQQLVHVPAPVQHQHHGLLAAVAHQLQPHALAQGLGRRRRRALVHRGRRRSRRLAAAGTAVPLLAQQRLEHLARVPTRLLQALDFRLRRLGSVMAKALEAEVAEQFADHLLRPLREAQALRALERLGAAALPTRSSPHGSRANVARKAAAGSAGR